MAAISTRLALFAALLLVACNGATDPLHRAEDDLAAHRTRWTLAGIHDYAFDYQRIPGNIADPGAQFDPVHVEVRADRVASVTDERTGAAVSTAGWPTVDDLFSDAASAITAGAHGDGTTSAVIHFDSRYGYPTLVSFGIPDTGGEQASGLQPASAP